MSTVARVVETDLGFDRIRREIIRLEGQSVLVGIQSDAGDEQDGASIVNVAAWNEFGTKTTPSRPFMRTMADTRGGSLHEVAVRAYDAMLAGGTAERTLGIVGEWYQGEQRRMVRDGPWLPNAPRTIAEKGSDTPLIDTGRMVASIRYEIVQGRPTE